jgi:hypothetical protein
LVLGPAPASEFRCASPRLSEVFMDSIIYLVGLIVIVLAILSFFGLH